MHEFIDSRDDVIALRVSHKITGADLDAIMDRLDRLFEAHEEVHVFVEIHRIDGIGLSGLPSYTARAMPLFGMLRRLTFSQQVSRARIVPWRDLRADERKRSASFRFG